MTTTAPQDIARQDAASFEVYRRLRDDIVACRLKPYERLRFEALRAEYNAGVGTLREALSHLVSDGLVRTEAGKGFYVAPVSADDLNDITSWRIEFERRALVLSIRNGDDNWEAEIVSSYHLLVRASNYGPSSTKEELTAFGDKHRRFHDALAAACGSPWLLYFRSVLFDQALRYQALAVIRSNGITDRTRDDHRSIMEAVLARDEQLAGDLIERHIRDTAEGVLLDLPDRWADAPKPEKSASRTRRKAAG